MSALNQSNGDAKIRLPKKCLVRLPFSTAGRPERPGVCRKVDATLTHDGTGRAVLASLSGGL